MAGKISEGFPGECAGCAWLRGCRKKENAPEGDGFHCLDFVEEETVRRMLEEGSGGEDDI